MSPKTVLVTDDDPDHREIVGTLLKFHGYAVTEATDGYQALDVIGRERPDLVIMDAQLPRLNGWDATRRLKADPGTASIPIIIFSAHVLPRDRERSKFVGCDAFIAKPIEPNRVLEVVAEKIGPPSP